MGLTPAISSLRGICLRRDLFWVECLFLLSFEVAEQRPGMKRSERTECGTASGWSLDLTPLPPSPSSIVVHVPYLFFPFFSSLSLSLQCLSIVVCRLGTDTEEQSTWRRHILVACLPSCIASERTNEREHPHRRRPSGHGEWSGIPHTCPAAR